MPREIKAGQSRCRNVIKKFKEPDCSGSLNFFYSVLLSLSFSVLLSLC